MTKVIFIRHAQSTANIGDIAFGNLEAPLTDEALNVQIPIAKQELRDKYGINPEDYSMTVAVSEYFRTQQTAKSLGFRNTESIDLLNESDIYNSDELAGVNVIEKHIKENGWLPEQELVRAREIIKRIQNGSLNYEIVVSHGMVIAGIVSELSRQASGVDIEPDPVRGYIPLQAQIIEVDI